MESNNVGKEHQRVPRLMVGIDVIAITCATQAMSVLTEVTCGKAFDLRLHASAIEDCEGGAKG